MATNTPGPNPAKDDPDGPVHSAKKGLRVYRSAPLLYKSDSVSQENTLDDMPFKQPKMNGNYSE